MARGHIRKRGDKWVVVVEVPSEKPGQRKQKWLTVNTEKEAQRLLTKTLRELDTNAYSDSRGTTVADFMERWLADYATPNCSEKTTQEYRKLIDGHVSPRLGKLLLEKVAPAGIQKFYAELLTKGRKDGRGGLSGRTCLHVHRVLHEAFGHAVLWQLLAINPFTRVEAPRAEKKRIRPPDAVGVVELLEKAQTLAPTIYPIILAAICTGLRRAEVLALRWSDIDLDAGMLTVHQSASQVTGKLIFKAPKSETSRRSVALPSILTEELIRHRGRQANQKLEIGRADYHDHDLIFAREDGMPRSPGSFSHMFAVFLKRAGLPPIRFHDLRHSYASQLIRQGVPLKTVSTLMGHSGISITADTYGHLLGGEEREAANILDAALRRAMEGR